MVHEDEWAQFLLGDSRTILGELPDDFADITITDPPYSERTHTYASTNRGARTAQKAVHFPPLSLDDLRDALGEVARVTRRWVIATLDYRHAVALEEDPPLGLAMLRVGVWTKTNPMPSISGDRPGMGWEAIAFLHRTDRFITWHGSGRSSVWSLPSESGAHPTTKPQPLLRDLVRLFSDAGDMVLDPYAGSGSTLVAAKFEGRRSLGVEIDPQWGPVARTRLAQDVIF